MTARKPPVKKTIAKRAPVKKAAAKKTTAKKAPAKKAPAKKTSVRGKTGARSSGMGAARPSKPRGGLHLVPPDAAAAAPEAETKSKTLKIATAAAASDERQILEALRARIAATLDSPNTPPRDLAALSRRLLEIQREIKALDADDDEDAIGEAARTPDAEFDASGI